MAGLQGWSRHVTAEEVCGNTKGSIATASQQATLSPPAQLPPVNPIHLADTAALARRFQSAQSFRHLLLKDFLAPDFVGAVLAEFPEPDANAMRSEFGDQSKKHTVEAITDLGPAFRRWDALLQSPGFIDWLETLTGIEGLLFDPGYEGAGTHNNLHGQSLDIHIDFNHHHATGHHRRLNLIVYLCDEWDPEWGGCIELHRDAWDRSPNRQFVSYPPMKNHAVLFETNEHSWHGFREIRLPADKRHLSRKSLTVYYYSATRPAEECAPHHSTIYVPDWIPETIRAGEVLTPAAYAELEQVMTRRDHYLQRLYARESLLQDRYARALRYLRPIRRLAVGMGLDGLIKRWFRN